MLPTAAAAAAAVVVVAVAVAFNISLLLFFFWCFHSAFFVHSKMRGRLAETTAIITVIKVARVARSPL